MARLKPYKGNPILTPKESGWDSVAVFNPAAFYWEGTFYLFYRAIGEYERYISRIGYATSQDGFAFQRFDHPIFEGVEPYECWGVEDPRTTILENKLYMTYVAHSARSGPPRAILPQLGITGEARERLLAERGIPRIALVSLDDMSALLEPASLASKWRRHGCITPEGQYQRDAVLFPERIDGLYVMLHRPRDWVGPNYGCELPSIWIAYSTNLQNWTGHKLVMQPEFDWEAEKIGTGPPPIKTKKGWLLIYHGVDDNHQYRAGAALLDQQNPARVIKRLPEPIFEPEALYEREGDVPMVVFPEGAVARNETLFIYYGAADKVCCVASGTIHIF